MYDDECSGEKDEDIRVVAELNIPRIYKDVQRIMLQEQKVKMAILKNKMLPFPCKCHQLCNFGRLLLPVVSAYERLYTEYAKLHKDYKKIFECWHIQTKSDTITCFNHVANALERRDKNPEEVADTERFPLESFRTDVYMKSERQNSLKIESALRKTYELHVESVRLYMIEVSKPRQERIADWIASHLIGNRRCICFHCDYRDALIAYRHAILSLHLEYLHVYISYYGLLRALRISDTGEKAKALRLLEEDATILKKVLF